MNSFTIPTARPTSQAVKAAEAERSRVQIGAAVGNALNLPPATTMPKA